MSSLKTMAINSNDEGAGARYWADFIRFTISRTYHESVTLVVVTSLPRTLE